MTPSIVQFVFHDHQITFALIPLLMTLIIFMWSVLEEVLKNTFSSYLISNLFIWIMTTIMTMTILLMLKKTAFCMEQAVEVFLIDPFAGAEAHIALNDSIAANFTVRIVQEGHMFWIPLDTVNYLQIPDALNCSTMKQALSPNESLALGIGAFANQPGFIENFLMNWNLYIAGGFDIHTVPWDEGIGVLRNILANRVNLPVLGQVIDMPLYHTFINHSLSLNHPDMRQIDEPNLMLAYFNYISMHNEEQLPWHPPLIEWEGVSLWTSVLIIIEHSNKLTVDILEVASLEPSIHEVASMNTMLKFIMTSQMINTRPTCVVGANGLNFIYLKRMDGMGPFNYTFDPNQNPSVTSIINMTREEFTNKFTPLVSNLPIFYQTFSRNDLIMVDPNLHCFLLYCLTIQAGYFVNL